MSLNVFPEKESRWSKWLFYFFLYDNDEISTNIYVIYLWLMMEIEVGMI